VPNLAPPTSGLTSAEAAARLKADGYNELPAPARRNLLRILFDVVRQPMFALLLAGGVVYLLLGDRLEAILLLVFATFSVTITWVQENRSERVLETLRSLASPRAQVMRDGKRVFIAGRDVVREDVLFLSEGDRVAADATLVSAHDLLVDESLLTGESVAVHKNARAPASVVHAPGGEGSPFVFAGTLVVRGSGLARVHATGLSSEMGKIGRSLQTIETEQPHVQSQIRWLVRDFAIFGAAAGGLTVVLFGLLRGSWLEAVLFGIAIGMSLLPEEFPLVTTVFMAMGAWRISRAQVLTRRTSAIETLGATTVLCTDKTGTLTENRMTVVSISDHDIAWRREGGTPLPAGALATLEAALLASPREASDPIDLAVHAMADVGGVAKRDAPPVRAYGLRPDLLAMANVYDEPAGRACFAKGAFEAIAALCRLPPQRQAGIAAQVDALARDGIRVLGVARAESFPAGADLPETLRGFAFRYVGLIGFSDPLRVEVPAAVAECRTAGVRVLMVTGDYPETARAIARQAGIGGELLTGNELEGMSDAALAGALRRVGVLARIRPEQKLRIVQCLKADGEVVAMTGDGVNDAPAIKAAHIGVAMGGRGTDVAREASSIVLLDGDFGSLVKTIRLGRRIYDNLRKAMEYIVAVHIPIAGLALIPLFLGLPLIFTPIHIAFLEMVIDPACSIVLEAEAEEADVMRRPPRDPRSPLLPRRRFAWALLQGATALAILAGLLIATARAGFPAGDVRAVVFVSLILVNLGLILVNRSFDSSPFRALMKPNAALRVLLAGVALVLAAAIFWPPARTLFRFGTLHWDDLAVCLAAGAVSLCALEAIKGRWFRA